MLLRQAPLRLRNQFKRNPSFLYYFGSTISAMLSNFLIIYFLVHQLSDLSYAKLVIYKVSLIIAVSVCNLGLSQAVVYFRDKIDQEQILIKHFCYLNLLFALPGTLLLCSLFVWYGPALTFQLSIAHSLVIYLTLALQLINNDFINLARASHQAKHHCQLTGLRALLQIACVVSVYSITSTVFGYFYAMLTAESLLLAFILISHRSVQRHTFHPFHLPLTQKLIRYGAPHALIISNGFLLNYLDRYMLTSLAPQQQVVAYYDVGCLIGYSCIALVARPFNLFIYPFYVRQFQECAIDCAKQISLYTQSFLWVSALLMASLLLIKHPLFIVFFPHDYLLAQSVLLPIMLAATLNGLFIAAVSGANANGTPACIPLATLSAVAINALLNLWLIPKAPLLGAAWATCLAAACQLLIGAALSKRYLKVNLHLLLFTAIGTGLFILDGAIH